jgi:hypothetical protein
LTINEPFTGEEEPYPGCSLALDTTKRKPMDFGK